MLERLTGLRWLTRRVVCLLPALACCHAPASADMRVTDDRGVVLQLAQTPRRIVSLLPSLTETVCALGACDRLVGVDRYSNWPQQVTRLPQLGGGLDPQIEAVLALRPDLVLVAQSSRAVARLQSLGLKVLAIEPKTHADARRVFALLGQVLAVPDAPALWQRIEADVAATERLLPAHARGWRVYFEVNRGPYAAAPTSFIGETITRLGLGNIVPGDLGPFPKINPEWVVRANPDLILIGERGQQALEERPGWRGLAALRAGRVCVFAPGQADVLVRPGPRMAEAARLVVDCVRRVGGGGRP